jgi:gliding motility-associated-like protein
MKTTLQVIFAGLIALFSMNISAQITIFQDNFEGTNSWLTSGPTTPNHWVISDCTNNGGMNAMYISSGGALNDCSPSGINHYGYVNSSSGSVSVFSYQAIDATCYFNMEVQADIQIDGEPGQDYVELVYSTNGGATWISIGGQLASNTTYSMVSTAIPPSLNFSSFLLGYRFTYNNSVIGTKPAAIDNFSLKGTSNDLTPPSITCPSVPMVYTDSYCHFYLANYGALALTNDNCSSVLVTQSPVVGTDVNANTTITLLATDAAGNTNSCVFQLVVKDTTKPKLTCPVIKYINVGVNCDAQAPNLIPEVLVEEHCSPYNALLITQNPVSGTILSADQNVFVYVTDTAGNMESCFTHVILVDTIPPSVTCPPTQTVSTNNGCSFNITDFTGLVSASDNCSSTFLFNQLPSVGNSLATGSHSITIQVYDAVGNVGSCHFSLLVQDSIDPSITCPATPIQIPANSSCQAILGTVSSAVTVNDNCTATPLINLTQSQPISQPFSGTISVTITATDLSGNSSSCVLQATAIDTTKPVVTCLIDTALTVTSSCNMTIPNLTGTHTGIDNCTASNLLTITQNPVAGTNISAPTNIIITYTDQSGNSGTCITFAKPNENIAPTITCPPSQTINNGSSCFALLPDLTGSAIVSDNCSTFITVTQQPVPAIALSTGTNIITLTATDAAGNATSCTTTYTILENVAPSITCPSDITSCNPKVLYTQPVGSDNCYFKVVQTDLSGLSSGSIFPVGTTQLTYQVIDSSGNNASCSFNVTVLDYPDTAKVLNNPTYLCNTFSTNIEAQAIQSGVGSWSVVLGSGLIANPSLNQTSVSNLTLGNNVFVWTVNSVSCGLKTDTLRIIVNLPPTQAQLPDSIFVCSLNNNLIQGNQPTVGLGFWSSDTTIVFNNINAPVATILSIPDGYHTVYWTIASSGCVSTVDSAVIYAPNTANILTPDTTICFENLPLAIVGNPAGPNQTPYWILLEGTAEVSNKYSVQTALTSAAVGELSYIYRLKHTQCGFSQDTIRITVENCTEGFEFSIPTVFTPNKDGDNDYFNIKSLHHKAPDCQVTIINRWGSKVFESTGYVEPWDGTFKGENMPTGTYFYEIYAPSGQFKPIKGSISIIR